MAGSAAALAMPKPAHRRRIRPIVKSWQAAGAQRVKRALSRLGSRRLTRKSSAEISVRRNKQYKAAWVSRRWHPAARAHHTRKINSRQIGKAIIIPVILLRAKLREAARHRA